MAVTTTRTDFNLTSLYCKYLKDLAVKLVHVQDGYEWRRNEAVRWNGSKPGANQRSLVVSSDKLKDGGHIHTTFKILLIRELRLDIDLASI